MVHQIVVAHVLAVIGGHDHPGRPGTHPVDRPDQLANSLIGVANRCVIGRECRGAIGRRGETARVFPRVGRADGRRCQGSAMSPRWAAGQVGIEQVDESKRGPIRCRERIHEPLDQPATAVVAEATAAGAQGRGDRGGHRTRSRSGDPADPLAGRKGA